ncbi:hypothetical protein [Sphingopyxis sp. JAI128]|uniref:hypothetical protein n=1 Tax=Sphingopyxis sp. JAI128 TaxID=2723066 RepID=UPI0016106804|nr:hypothetical protein [Sphingopyxis sp. JAI128]MBB6426099.1 hypothetical protein [Sphingopyxis sp. JAI128]
MDAEVINNVEKRCFKLDLPEGSTADTFYRVDEEGRLVLIHTVSFVRISTSRSRTERRPRAARIWATRLHAQGQ